MAERVHPVVWGKRQGPLSREQVTTYERDGYVSVPRWLSGDECRVLLEEVERLARQGDENVMEPDDVTVRSVFDVHRNSVAAKRVLADDRLAGVAEQLLGSAVSIHHSRINFKPGFRGAPFQWHSDFETWHVEDGMPAPRALSAVVMLCTNYAHNGPLMVIPGSHRTFVRCPSGTHEDHYRESLRAQRYGVPTELTIAMLVGENSIVQVTGEVGTVVFFDSNLMHGSAGNMTPYPRHNMFAVFNSVDNALVAPFGSFAPRPAFLADRECAPLRPLRPG